MKSCCSSSYVVTFKPQNYDCLPSLLCVFAKKLSGISNFLSGYVVLHYGNLSCRMACVTPKRKNRIPYQLYWQKKRVLFLCNLVRKFMARMTETFYQNPINMNLLLHNSYCFINICYIIALITSNCIFNTSVL